MKQQDLRQIRQLFNEGFEQVVLPDVERVDGELVEINAKLTNIDRKLDNTISRVDNHSVRIERIEKAKS